MDAVQAQNCIDCFPLLRGKSFPKGTWRGCAAHVMAVAKGVALHENPLKRSEGAVVPGHFEFHDTFGVSKASVALCNDKMAPGSNGDRVVALLESVVEGDGNSHLLPE